MKPLFLDLESLFTFTTDYADEEGKGFKPFVPHLVKNNGFILNLLEIGPGGGNPCITFAFVSEKSAKTFIDDIDELMGFSATDGLKFYKDRIQRVSLV